MSSWEVPHRQEVDPPQEAAMSPLVFGVCKHSAWCGTVNPRAPRLNRPSRAAPQALRSCHRWSTGTPPTTEAQRQTSQKCWSSVEGTATRTSASVARLGAAARLLAGTTAPTTSSYGGCDPSPGGPGRGHPPALGLLASSLPTHRLWPGVVHLGPHPALPKHS